MSSHIRVLTESEGRAPLDELRLILGSDFELIVEEGNEQEWSQLLLRHKNGPEIALVERDPVTPGDLGAQEIEELKSEIQSARPQRAVEWLKHYFSHVKTIYSLQPMSGADVNDGWFAVQRVEAYFWKKFGGILQADNEGFTNREGQHVLWQFYGPQEGELEAAVMDDTGRWLSFVMDMADPEQVAAFQRGEVPAGAIRR